MKTSFCEGLTRESASGKIRKFYELGSPYYLQLYGEHIHDGYYATGKEPRTEAQENLIRFLVEKAGIRRGARILDVGCGVGGGSIWLAKNLGAVTVGITNSPVQLEIARKLANDHKVDASFLLMDAEDIHVPGRFDVIWVVAALAHFSDQRRFLKSAAGLLEPEGKLVIFDWVLKEGVAAPESNRHIKSAAEGLLLAGLYSISTYTGWLAGAGYQVLYAEDITSHTAQTWDDALALLKDPAVLRLASRAAFKEGRELFRLVKGIRAMRLAIKNGELGSAVIVAQKGANTGVNHAI